MTVTVPLCVYFLSLFLWLQAGVDKIKSSHLGLILFSEETSDMVTNGVHRVGRTVRLFSEPTGRNLGKGFEISVLSIDMQWGAVGALPWSSVTSAPVSCCTTAALFASELLFASRHPLPPWGWVCSSRLTATGVQKESTCLKVGQCCGAVPDPQAPCGWRLKATQLRPHLCLLPSPALLPSSLSPQLPLPINHTCKNPCHRLCF